MRATVVVTLFAVFFAACASAQSRDSVKTYFFGNSLVTHVSGTDETAVLPWLAQFARSDGRTFAADGQFGFLRNFAADLPPLATWRFADVPRAWRRGRQEFADAGFDSVVISPANFIQDVPPDTPYRNGSGQSPLGETLKVIDWLMNQDLNLRIFIYGGWPEMASITRSFPPDRAGLLAYHAVAQGADRKWYAEFVAQLKSERPSADIRLIPVGARLAQALSVAPFDTIPALDLYQDDAPHGTPTLYAMAALVTYLELFDARPPANLQLPASVHPLVRQNLDRLVDFLSSDQDLDTQDAITREQVDRTPDVAKPKPAQPRFDPPKERPRLELTGPPGTGLENPALAMGLNGIADWTAQQPFLDVMKTARPWIGHSAEQWGAFSFEALQAADIFDQNGWPRRLPEGADRLESFVLTDMDPSAEALAGTYVLRYQGRGDLQVSGRANRVRYRDGEITFQYRPGDGVVGIVLHNTDPRDPIRNISIVREDRLALHEAGALFNPDWLTLIHDVRSVRFMDWMQTNASPIQSWDERPRTSDFSWGWRGVPLEVMIRLSNRIGADPWFTLPHQAGDAYMTQFAVAVRDGLDPRLQAYVEYSNELWNFTFPQTHWALKAAEERWGAGLPDDAWIQFAGARTAEMSEIWQKVYGLAFADRVKIVMAVHTGWQGLEQAQLNAPLWRKEQPDRKPPSDYAQAYAVTGYFGYEFGTEAFAPLVDQWIEDSVARATRLGEAEGKRRVALRVFVEERQFDIAHAPAADALRNGGLRDLISDVWPYHAKAARDAGLELVMYEGGSHVAGHGARANDERLSAFFNDFNYTADMAELYELLLDGWIDAGGTLFNAFVDVATPTKWGSWGALRHLSDTNPRWDVLMRYNAEAQPRYTERAPGTFLNGVTRIGGAGRDLLEGTVEEDVLIGGPGDDLLVSRGRGDILDGGSGRDTARLPGRKDMYEFEQVDGTTLHADGPHGRVILKRIERLEFGAEPGIRVAVSSLF